MARKFVIVTATVPKETPDEGIAETITSALPPSWGLNIIVHDGSGLAASLNDN